MNVVAIIPTNHSKTKPWIKLKIMISSFLTLFQWFVIPKHIKFISWLKFWILQQILWKQISWTCFQDYSKDQPYIMPKSNEKMYLAFEKVDTSLWASNKCLHWSSIHDIICAKFFISTILTCICSHISNFKQIVAPSYNTFITVWIHQELVNL